NIRYKTSSPLSLLKPGSVFSGVQKSGTDEYPVTIEVQSVDIERSKFCGYLSIQNLTEEFPSVSTYFESEIIGDRYSFITNKWESDYQNDMEHWTKFSESKQENCILNTVLNEHKDDINNVKFNPINKDFIYMRWKEMFLVPDHKVKNIEGISFCGFYYICFNVSTGNIQGYYYHPSANEKFQELHLNYQSNQYQFAEFEFR
ncbi:hypothetical protein K502DRAFT_278915, partial [Neoconidiobolus thromboides FSU 785]